MSTTLTPAIIRDTADRLLRGGLQPNVESICQQLGVADDGSIGRELENWWLGLSARVSVATDSDTEAPDAMARQTLFGCIIG